MLQRSFDREMQLTRDLFGIFILTLQADLIRYIVFKRIQFDWFKGAHLPQNSQRWNGCRWKYRSITHIKWIQYYHVVIIFCLAFYKSMMQFTMYNLRWKIHIWILHILLKMTCIRSSKFVHNLSEECGWSLTLIQNIPCYFIYWFRFPIKFI